jgi:hypothetical protein
MKTKRQAAWEFVLGWAGIAGIAWGIWWLTDGAVHRARFWWTMATVFFFVPMALYAGFFAWMIVSWKRQSRRESRQGERDPAEPRA